MNEKKSLSICDKNSQIAFITVTLTYSMFGDISHSYYSSKSLDSIRESLIIIRNRNASCNTLSTPFFQQ